MSIGFVVASTSGHAEPSLFVTRQSSANPLISTASRPDHLAVVLGRLYYQDEWRKKVDCPPGCNEAELLLLAVERFGVDILRQFEGDFAAVVGDRRRNEITGFRDLLGGYPLFWLVTPSIHAISTSLHALARLLPAPQLDRSYFADYLLFSSCRNEVGNSRTAYAGISRVGGGELVRIGANSHVDRVFPDEWSSRIVDPATERLDQAADRYCDVLKEAVSQRSRGRVLAQLSGGMDSTSIAILAREVARADGPDPALDTISLVYESFPKLSQDRRYIELVLDQAPGLRPNLVAADGILNFDGFTRPPTHEEPYAGLWHVETELALLERARSIQADTMLTGLGGDEVLDTAPFFLADRLCAGRFVAAWQGAAAYARWRGKSPLAVLRCYGWEPLRASSRIVWGSQTAKSLSLQTDATVPPWISPDFALEQKLAERARAVGRAPYRFSNDIHMSVAIHAITERTGDVTRQLAANQGLHISHPFLDPRVIGLGLGLRARFSTILDRQKPILAQAMRGRLPQPITARRHKGHFDEVYYRGVVRNREILHQLVDGANSYGLPIFDTAVLRKCLREAEMSVVGAAQLKRLDYTLALLRWLSLRNDWLGADRDWVRVFGDGNHLAASACSSLDQP